MLVMKKFLIGRVAAFLTATALAGAAQAQTVARPHWVPKAAAGSPGCAVGVSINGETGVTHWGEADLDHDLPIADDTVFHAASLAKQFTAYAVARLAAEGRLSLDDEVRRHLPELPDYGRPITVRHLIHHTSGLRDQGALLFLAGWRADDRITRSDALDAIFRQTGLNFPPGEQDLYNNSGYTLLAEIVLRVSGKPLAAYAQETIFEPLGLEHTRFYDDPAATTPRRARAYRTVDGSWRLAEPNMEVYGASNLLTTVNDLLIWQRHLLSPSAAARPIVDWMLQSGALADGTPTGYGGGLHLADTRAHPSFGHDGLDGGFRARTLAVPSEDLAIAVLCNSAAANPESIVDAILADQIPPPPPSLDNDVLQHDLAIAGLYWSPDNDAVMELYTETDGSLARRSPPGRVLQGPDGDLRIGAERWRYEPATDGRPARLKALYDPLPSRTFELVVDPGPEDIRLDNFAGAYRSDDLAMTYRVSVQDGRLWIEWDRISPIQLSPAGPNRFFSPALGTVTFSQRPGSGVTGLTLSLRRVWRVPAHRVDLSPVGD